MKPKPFFSCVVAAVLAATAVSGADLQVSPVQLPAPRTESGRPLMQALRDRKTTRELIGKPLTPQTLADLLWAGFGVNRAATGNRTAPSAMNSQELDLYVAMAHGVSRYDAKKNQLVPIAPADVRSLTGGQDFVKQAPVALILVADLAQMTKARPADKERYAWIHAGCVSQNISLFCASEGLGTVVHELDRTKLESALKLRPEQKIIIAQSVGYPKEQHAPQSE